jgi:hypothetical protein
VAEAVAVVAADAEAKPQAEKGQMARLEAMGQADLPALVALVAPPEQTLHLQNKKMQEMEGRADTVKEGRRVCLCNS